MRTKFTAACLKLRFGPTRKLPRLNDRKSVNKAAVFYAAIFILLVAVYGNLLAEFHAEQHDKDIAERAGFSGGARPIYTGRFKGRHAGHMVHYTNYGLPSEYAGANYDHWDRGARWNNHSFRRSYWHGNEYWGGYPGFYYDPTFYYFTELQD
jgi:hypothetical protein